MDNFIYTPEQLGKVLKGIRKSQGITQINLGKEVGLLQKTVSLLETDPKRSNIESLFKILSALGLAITITEKSKVVKNVDTDEW